MLKSSSIFLGGTITSQKCSKNEALHEIGEVLRHAKDRMCYSTEDGVAEYYTVCQNKCILKSFKFLANKLGIRFTWTHCLSMITF